MGGALNDYIQFRIEKSRETFDDAKLLMENDRWNSCVNRLYYSSFYLISALLHKNGFKAESHNGVKTQFNLNYIKVNKLPIIYGKLFSNLFDWRQESDYADFVDFDKELVVPLISEVEEFNKLLTDLINA